MKHLILMIFCFVMVTIAEEQQYAPVVKIDSGKVRGLIHKLDENHQIYLYKGIRFAEANRFEKPKPVKSIGLEGTIYDAVNDGNTCPQFVKAWDMNKMFPSNRSEDCLFLNVYKPIIGNDNDNNRKLLPVMVWIYGGGFQTGTIFSPIYDCSYVAALGDVIVVNLNYRLGPLGFLYGATENAPGNQGLHDQIMGLKWVKNNIQSFGGDPNQVTIFGISAGSISVSALVLSPLAQGLFNRAILQSGTIRPGVVISNQKDSLDRTKKFAEKFDCPNEDMSKLLACLKSKSVEELVEVGDLPLKDLFSNKPFFPMIDGELILEIDSKLEQSINAVDLIYGVTKDEGSMFASVVAPKLMDDQSQFTMNEVQQIIRSMVERYQFPQSEEIVQFYTKNLDVSNLKQVRKMLSDCIGDLQLTCPTMLFPENLPKKGKHFFSYRFDRRSPLSEMMHCPEWMGTCHGAELFYMLGNPMLKNFPDDQKLSHQLIKAWTEFAKTGRPGPIGDIEWEEAFNSKEEYKQTDKVMLLDLESQMIQNPFQDSCNGLWNKKFSHIKSKSNKQEL